MAEVNYRKLYEKDEVEIHSLRNRLGAINHKIPRMVADGATAKDILNWLLLSNAYHEAFAIKEKTFRFFLDDPGDPGKFKRMIAATDRVHELEGKLGYYQRSDLDDFKQRMTKKHEEAKDDSSR